MKAKVAKRDSPRDFRVELDLSLEIGVDVRDSMDNPGFGMGLGM